MEKRLRISILGAVQGVGFRPFIHRLATELGLSGWVMNTSTGVIVEVEGDKQVLDSFLVRISKDAPPRASIQSMEPLILDPVGYSGFSIRSSDPSKEISTSIMADIATCPECLHDISDPGNRRFLYPFTNCTNCGPRFSIITALPYDRVSTTMAGFSMCPECRKEYEDLTNRRFHAQPIACPTCGPELELWNPDGGLLSIRHMALLEAAQAVREGKILAIKGLGGFQLIVDARNEEATKRLRQSKRREEKPLALMFPSLSSVRTECSLSELEERLLLSPEAPIVLLKRLSNNGNTLIALSVAPRNPNLGVMLPYTPLHHLFMHELGFPVVATSGNFAEETICTDEYDALQRLHGIASLFLVHNRPIAHHVDDSVVRVILDRELVMRRARGYAPLPIDTEHGSDLSILAVGGQLKNSVALSVGNKVVVSQHIGDLGTEKSFEAFRKTSGDLLRLYGKKPDVVVSDSHPDYVSTFYAKGMGYPHVQVQHHHAHVAACMAENHLAGEVLGVAWDGTGYGPDGTVWGGEFLVTSERGYKRFASLRPFRLPGGERAVREPRRSALGLLYAMFGDQIFDDERYLPVRTFSKSERRLLRSMLADSVNSPVTTSMGRLFDGVASLIGLCQAASFEGQAAMELEHAIGDRRSDAAYPVRVVPLGVLFQVDWFSMLEGILSDLSNGVAHSLISLKFHNALAESVIEVARLSDLRRVVLTGGCFQNAYLTERTIHLLQYAGNQPYWHQRIPPNDGGISLGQVMVVENSLDLRELGLLGHEIGSEIEKNAVQQELSTHPEEAIQ